MSEEQGLDEASAAFAALTAEGCENADGRDETLERILTSLKAEQTLDEAARALRELEVGEAGGDPAGEDPTLAQVQATLRAEAHEDPEAVLDRAIGALRDEERQGATPFRFFWAAAAVALVALGAPTAWAFSSGRAQAWLSEVGILPAEATASRSQPTDRPSSAERRSAPPSEPAPPRNTPQRNTPQRNTPQRSTPQRTDTPSNPHSDREPESAVSNATTEERTATPPAQVRSSRARPSAPSDEQPSQPEASSNPRAESEVTSAQSEAGATDSDADRPDPETLAFQNAHRVHFHRSDRSAALRAWDAYLARYPHGRFEPEARYNRAITLTRLGRRAEARQALTPFAEGTFGGYRQREATELLAALRESASP